MHRSRVMANPTGLVIRWSARVLSILFMAVFVIMVVRQGVPVHEMTLREWVSFFFFPLGASLGMILGWRREGLGGAITLASVFIGILVHDVSAGGTYALTCASPGLLFVFSWLLSGMGPDPDEAPA